MYDQLFQRMVEERSSENVALSPLGLQLALSKVNGEIYKIPDHSNGSKTLSMGVIREGLTIKSVVHFSDQWGKEFERISDMLFNNGLEQHVPMMECFGEFSYAGGEYPIVVIPYKDDFEMIVIVGNYLPVGFPEETEPGKIIMPLFALHCASQLSESMLSGEWDGLEDVTDIFHDVKVEVDEKGTVAEAYTSISVCGTCYVPPPPFKLIVDKPFLFVIRNRQLEYPVILGRIFDPINHGSEGV